ncbi:MAG: hypothetical protein HYY91_00095, partial [Candidatus Omnitrophica bacterium]|nr:hypothetical protein [Candidatus Omnitrophota bacterium]
MRLCFLGPVGSIHLQRWVRYFAERGHDVHLVSYARTSSDIPGLQVHGLVDQPAGRPDAAEPEARQTGLLSGLKSRMPEGLAILRMGFRWLQHGLRRTVREIHPDILHGHFVSEH